MTRIPAKSCTLRDCHRLPPIATTATTAIGLPGTDCHDCHRIATLCLSFRPGESDCLSLPPPYRVAMTVTPGSRTIRADPPWQAKRTLNRLAGPPVLCYPGPVQSVPAASIGLRKE